MCSLHYLDKWFFALILFPALAVIPPANTDANIDPPDVPNPCTTPPAADRPRQELPQWQCLPPLLVSCNLTTGSDEFGDSGEQDLHLMLRGGTFVRAHQPTSKFPGYPRFA